MKKLVAVSDSPESWPERKCSQYPVETFFPAARDHVGVQAAVDVCMECPLLRRCAAWARPLVEDKSLEECVVAGVYVPQRRYTAARREVLGQLAVIANPGVAERGEAA